MYFTCEDREFAGFLNSEARIYTKEDKIKNTKRPRLVIKQ